eukprot:2814577-Pleurochrysis_carterae.AAC.1
MWEDAGWQPPTGFEIFNDDEGLCDDYDADERGVHACRPPSVATVHHHISLISRAAHMGAEASAVGLAYVERLISITNQPIAPHNWKKIVLVAGAQYAQRSRDGVRAPHATACALLTRGRACASIAAWTPRG